MGVIKRKPLDVFFKEVMSFVQQGCSMPNVVNIICPTHSFICLIGMFFFKHQCHLSNIIDVILPTFPMCSGPCEYTMHDI
jgi:hypothetical protein